MKNKNSISRIANEQSLSERAQEAFNEELQSLSTSDVLQSGNIEPQNLSDAQDAYVRKMKELQSSGHASGSTLDNKQYEFTQTIHSPTSKTAYTSQTNYAQEHFKTANNSTRQGYTVPKVSENGRSIYKGITDQQAEYNKNFRVPTPKSPPLASAVKDSTPTVTSVVTDTPAAANRTGQTIQDYSSPSGKQSIYKGTTNHQTEYNRSIRTPTPKSSTSASLVRESTLTATSAAGWAASKPSSSGSARSIYKDIVDQQAEYDKAIHTPTPKTPKIASPTAESAPTADSIVKEAPIVSGAKQITQSVQQRSSLDGNKASVVRGTSPIVQKTTPAAPDVLSKAELAIAESNNMTDEKLKNPPNTRYRIATTLSTDPNKQKIQSVVRINSYVRARSATIAAASVGLAYSTMKTTKQAELDALLKSYNISTKGNEGVTDLIKRLNVELANCGEAPIPLTVKGKATSGKDLYALAVRRKKNVLKTTGSTAAADVYNVAAKAGACSFYNEPPQKKSKNIIKTVGGKIKSMVVGGAVIATGVAVQSTGMTTQKAGKVIKRVATLAKPVVAKVGRAVVRGGIGIGRALVDTCGKYGGDAGKGLAITIKAVAAIYKSIRTTYRTTYKLARVLKNVAQKAKNLGYKAAIKAARKVANIAGKAGKKGVEKVANKVADKLEKKLAKKVKKSLSNKIKSTLKDRGKKIVTKTAKKMGKAARKIASRLPQKVIRAAKMAARAAQRAIQAAVKLAKAAASVAQKVAVVVANAISAIIGALPFIAIPALIIGLIILFVWGFINIFEWAYNFALSDKTMQRLTLSAVEVAYLEDQASIDNIIDTHDYESVTITYDNVADTEAYEEHKADFEYEAFAETTNIAEVISVALTMNDQDPSLETDDGTELDEVDADDLEDRLEDLDESEDGGISLEGGFEFLSQCAYLRDLNQVYHGSHRIIVEETTYTTTETDANGNTYEVEHTSANIIYRSYYFEDIFTCEPAAETSVEYTTGSASSSSIAVGDIESVEQVYAYLRSQGLSHAGACGIMGNIQAESSFNPEDGGRSAAHRGLIQWSAKSDGTGAWYSLVSYCQSNGLDEWSISGQLSFLIYDLQTTDQGCGFYYDKLWSQLCSTNDVKYAASIFCAGYERCIGGSDAYDYWTSGSSDSPSLHYKPYSSARYLYQNLSGRIRYAQDFASQMQQYEDNYEQFLNTASSNAVVEYAIQFDYRNITSHSGWSKIQYQLGGSGRGHTLEECATSNLKTDCSGFVNSVFMHFNITVPLTSAGNWDSSKQVSYEDRKPGDIIVWSGKHVALYIGYYKGDGKEYAIHQSNGSNNPNSLKIVECTPSYLLGKDDYSWKWYRYYSE